MFIVILTGLGLPSSLWAGLWVSMTLWKCLVEESSSRELSTAFEDSHWGSEAQEDWQEVTGDRRQPVIHPCLPPFFATACEERSYRRHWGNNLESYISCSLLLKIKTFKVWPSSPSLWSRLETPSVLLAGVVWDGAWGQGQTTAAFFQPGHLQISRPLCQFISVFWNTAKLCESGRGWRLWRLTAEEKKAIPHTPGHKTDVKKAGC